MSGEPIQVLFVCYPNASRSILAEAILRRVGGDRFAVSSAGIEPAGVHALTRRVLDDAGLAHDWAASKGVETFRDGSFDYVITVCDDARTVCPVFPGADQSFHWGYPEPANVVDEDARLAAFQHVFTDLGTRIRQFVVVTDRVRRVVPA